MSEIYGTFSTAYVEAMRLRLSALEPENQGLSARIAALDAEAKQAREDEAWAHDAGVTINPMINPKGYALSLWSVRYRDGAKTLEVTAPTIHAALRALRAKVEGGAR